MHSVSQADRTETTLTSDGEQHGAVHQLCLGDEHFTALDVADWREDGRAKEETGEQGKSAA